LEVTTELPTIDEKLRFSVLSPPSTVAVKVLMVLPVAVEK
jgi:hypothetical protein